jgi:hypothetical protein
MTSDIDAPAAGSVDGSGGLLPVGPGLAAADVWVLLGVCSEWPPTPCEHPTTSDDTAIRAAIRIQSG